MPTPWSLDLSVPDAPLAAVVRREEEEEGGDSSTEEVSPLGVSLSLTFLAVPAAASVVATAAPRGL